MGVSSLSGVETDFKVDGGMSVVVVAIWAFAVVVLSAAESIAIARSAVRFIIFLRQSSMRAFTAPVRIHRVSMSCRTRAATDRRAGVKRSNLYPVSFEPSSFRALLVRSVRNTHLPTYRGLRRRFYLRCRYSEIVRRFAASSE